MGSGRAAGTTTGEATTLVDVRPFDSMLSADVWDMFDPEQKNKKCKDWNFFCVIKWKNINYKKKFKTF